MPATMQIDQAGLPAGTPGFSRSDGLDTGALVTLTSTGGGSTHDFELLAVPSADGTSVASLAQTGPTTWTFSPDALVYGSWRIRLVVDAGLATESEQIRTFGVRTPTLSLRIPAWNEIASALASLANLSGMVQQSETNEPSAAFPAGDPRGWFPGLEEALLALDAVVAGVAADHIESAPGLYSCPPAVIVGDAVYLTGPNAVDQAFAAGIATCSNVLGIVTAIPAPGFCTVVYAGEVGAPVGVAGGPWYVSDVVPGALTLVQPVIPLTVVQPMGAARAPGALILNVGPNFIN